MKKLILLAVLSFPLAAQIPFEAVVAGLDLDDLCGDVGVPRNIPAVQ